MINVIQFIQNVVINMKVVVLNLSILNWSLLDLKETLQVKKKHLKK